jgi:hypothetical protein
VSRFFGVAFVLVLFTCVDSVAGARGRSSLPALHSAVVLPANSAASVADRGDQLLRETFVGTSTPANEWAWTAPACLTAGNAQTPPSSIPACGGSAKQNRPGYGVLELTPPLQYTVSLVGYYQPFSTSHGLRIRWNLYSFNGTGSDGTLLWMTYGDKPQPMVPAGTGGHLGYTDGMAALGFARTRGMANAYIGIGFDEAGNFSAFLPGGPGNVPDTVAIGGAERIGYHYLTGVENASGQPVSLPFSLEQPSSPTRPKTPISVEVTLRSEGLLTVAFDIHDGNGYVTYLSKNVVGIARQPRVPRKVWIGLNGSNGANYERHQIDDLRVSALR